MHNNDAVNGASNARFSKRCLLECRDFCHITADLHLTPAVSLIDTWNVCLLHIVHHHIVNNQITVLLLSKLG
jgi:hypothetical protein